MKWPVKKLADLCVKITDGSHNPPKGVEEGFPMLSSRNIFNHGINFEGVRFLTEEDFTSENKRTDVEPGDVLLTIVGTIGRVIVLPKGLPKFTLQRSVAVIKTSDEIDEYYLAQYLSSPDVQDYLMSQARGGAQKGFYLKDIKDLDIPLPPLEEQKQIVKVLEDKLGKVKEAIELRQDSIADTEKILSAKLTEIFSGGKERGWEEKTMDELCEVARGGSPRPIKDYLTEDKDGINWVKIGDASASDRYIYKTRQKIKQDGVKKTRLVHSGDLLLTNSMSFGRPYIMKTEGAIHDGWLLLSPREKVVPEYLYYFLSSPDLYRQFKNLAGGAVVQNLNSQLVRGVKVSLPDFATQEKIVEELDELSSQVSELRTLQEEQLADLKSLERAYLHEAFNGELV